MNLKHSMRRPAAVALALISLTLYRLVEPDRLFSYFELDNWGPLVAATGLASLAVYFWRRD